MTNLQRVGGKVEVAKKRYFGANPWVKGMTEKAKLDSFCEWCDRECKVAYYEVYFNDNQKDVFKFKNFSEVGYILGSVTNKKELFEQPCIHNDIRSYLNDHRFYCYCWGDEFGEEHCINITAIYE